MGFFTRFAMRENPRYKLYFLTVHTLNSTARQNSMFIALLFDDMQQFSKMQLQTSNIQFYMYVHRPKERLCMHKIVR